MTGMIVSLRILLCAVARRGKFDCKNNIIVNILVLSIALLIIPSCLPVLFEPKSRIREYVIFMLPRAMEGIWELLDKLDYVKSIPQAQNLIFSFSLGFSLYLRKFYSDVFPTSYSNLVDFVFGNI